MSKESEQAPTSQNNAQPPQEEGPTVPYDYIEVIAQHGEVVLSKLENLRVLLGPNTPLPQALDNSKKKKKALLDSLTAYEKYVRGEGEYPKQEPRKPGKTPWPVTLLEHCIEPYKILRYASQWIRIARQCLLDTSRTADFDIRWNQLLTVKFCQIFTSFCRVFVFMKSFSIVKIISLIVPYYIDDIPELKEYVTDSRKLINLITLSLSDPFANVYNLIQPVGKKLNRLAATIGTYIAQLFGPFPLIEWANLSIFRKPPETPETTLEDDDFFILRNITLLKDTMVYFVTVFSQEIGSDSDSFNVVIENLLTESPVVPITVTTRVPIRDFLKYSRRSPINDDVQQVIDLSAPRKFATSHRKRIQNVTILLNEIKSMCEFNNNLVCQYFPNIISLCALGYYEFSQYFTFDKNSVCVDALDLLAELLDMVKIIRQNHDDIQRFFIYNLSTIDVEFLKAQIAQINNDSPIPSLLNPLVSALETLSIDDYDKGSCYHFLGYNLTYGRILYYYNHLHNTSIVSYAEPLFEHLTTILTHAEFAEDPTRCFFKYCPIQRLWTYSGRFVEHIVNPAVPISRCITLLEVFTYFAQDQNIYIYPKEKDNQKNNFELVQMTLLKRIRESLMRECNNSSIYHQLGLQTRDLCKDGADKSKDHFNLNKFKFTSNVPKEELIKQFTEQNQFQKELRGFFTRVPQQIRVFDEIKKPSAYFENGLTQNISSYLFPTQMPEGMSLDRGFSTAFQFLWQIFAQMGKPFPRNMFRARLFEGTQASSDNYIQHVNLMTGVTPYDGLIPKSPSLVESLQYQIFKFIKQSFKQSIYLAPLRGFFDISDKSDIMSFDSQSSSKNKDKDKDKEKDPDVDEAEIQHQQQVQAQLDATPKVISSDFFSQKAIKYMITNLGANSGFAFDRIVTLAAAECIVNIFKKYIECIQYMPEWYSTLRNKGSLPQDSLGSPTFNFCCTEMIRLGCAMTLREIVLIEMKTGMSNSVPGIQQIIDAAIDRITVTLTGKEHLICEACSLKDSMYFIQQNVEKAKIDKQSDFSQFMFFIGLLLNNNIWNDSKYYADYEAISRNLHLFPIALKAFIQVKNSLFVTVDDLALEHGFKVFYSIFGTIVNQKKVDNGKNYAKAMAQLAIAFPRSIEIIQFGWLHEVFPNYDADLMASIEIVEDRHHHHHHKGGGSSAPKKKHSQQKRSSTVVVKKK